MDTCKVFSILRLVDSHPDPSERLFQNFASRRGVWFQFLGREKDLNYMTDLRVEHLRWIEDHVWTMSTPNNTTKVYITVQVRFISGDNKLLWTESGIRGGHYRCSHCTCPDRSPDWLSYKPIDLRNHLPYTERNLWYQFVASLLGDGTGSITPPLVPFEGRSSTIFSCAVMHNLRGVLRVWHHS